MADYGVNIKVGVQGQSNARQLGEQIREIVSGLEAADRAFTRFSNNLKSFDQRRAQRKINEELDKTAQNYRELDRLQRRLLANDNSAIKAAEKRAKLEEFISKNISAGRMRRRARFLRGDPEQYPSGANQPFAPDPMVAVRKQRDAEAKFAREIFDIEQDFARKLHNTEIDLLQERIKREMDAQQEIFSNAMRLNQKAADDFDRRLAQSTRDRSEATRLTGQTSPIGGAVGIPGSPAALRAADRAQRLRSASSSALIGGAFPLLFGQGLGAAGGGLIGGFGGGMIGGEFGFGLSLIGTQLGSLIDQFATKASELGAALNPLTADIEAVAAAAGESNTEFGQLLAAYEEEAGAKEALEFATNRLATVVGIDGVNALTTFNSDMVEAGNEFNKFTSIVLAGIADLINQSGFLRGAANLTERSRLLIGAQRSGDPEIQKLMKQRQEAQGKVSPFLAEFAPDIAAAQIGTVRSIEDQIILLQRANEARELGLQQAELTAKVSDKQLESLRGSRAELEARSVILKNNGDLLNKEVFNAETILINEKMRAKVDKILQTQKEATVKLSQEALTEQLEQAVLERDNELLELANRRASVQEAASRKQNAADEKAQKAIQRRIDAVDREITSTTRAFNEANNQLDSIINKNKDKVAFEKEYSRLIQEGSTPAAAKQAIELQKQLLQLDRTYDKLIERLDVEVLSLKASIAKAKAEGATEEALKDQVAALEEIERKIAGLEGKREGAEGAIIEALAPKSDRERLQEYLDKLQGQLNDLMDPVNQVISLAETLGGAFSESFKGIVTGSMSAREALANLFQRTADHFIDMAAQMIAAQLKMQAVKLFMSFFSPNLGGGGGDGTGFVIPTDGLTPTANGNAFGRNGVIPFAKGGVVNKPTLFPFANGTGLMGEAGPEAIMPLRRGPSGRLGVEALGGGAGATNIVVNVDASGSSVEGSADQAQQLGKAIGIAVQQELVKQKRPGGLLAS